MLNEDDISYVPKYVQIQNYILQKIKDGILTTGDRIPSEAELSKQFDVSRITVSTAIKELANARVVERIRGKGTYVLAPEGGTDKQSMAFASQIKIAPFEQSVCRPHKLMEHGIIPAGPALCAKLNLDQGTYVYKIVRCVCVDGQPNELDYNYLPLSVCSNHTFDSEALEKIFLHEYIRKYLNEKPTHIKIYVNTQMTEDMDISTLPVEREEDMFIWDNFVYKNNEVLALTTTVCVAQTNKAFITLEF